MIVVAWHWIGDTTMMVLADDMCWYRLEGVWPQSIHIEGLDTSHCEEIETTLVGSSKMYEKSLDEKDFNSLQPTSQHPASPE